MKLMRLATLYFDSLPDEWKKWNLRFGGDVIVHSMGSWELADTKMRLLVGAEIRLSKLPELEKNFIIVPKRERKNAEGAIEAIANLISVATMSKRLISSPSPCIAFRPENETELSWLRQTSGIPSLVHSVPSIQYKIDKEDAATALSGRNDGVQLLAEALASDHATGRLHELIRVFERAFKLSPHNLVNPLSEFLKEKGYSLEEVKHWIFELRDKSIHADKRIEYVSEADVRPHITRIEQAAYDVLFNKQIWKDPSTKRRKTLSPPVGITSSGFSITQGITGPSIDFHIYDTYFAYPFDLSSHINTLPDGLWSNEVNEDPYSNKDHLPSPVT